jgi:hypothetical protein
MLFSLSSQEAFEFVRRVMMRPLDLLGRKLLAVESTPPFNIAVAGKRLGICNASLRPSRGRRELCGPFARAGFEPSSGKWSANLIKSTAKSAPKMARLAASVRSYFINWR